MLMVGMGGLRRIFTMIAAQENQEGQSKFAAIRFPGT